MKKALIILLLTITAYSQDLSLLGFLNKLSLQESKGNYYVIGGAGGNYIGKYQFSNIVLREIGWGHITVSKFKADKSIFPPEKQEEAMLLLLERYRYYLSKEINKYTEKYFNGIYITEAGILAAVHGVGYPEVKAYFSGRSSKPTVIQKYLKQFSAYSIS